MRGAALCDSPQGMPTALVTGAGVRVGQAISSRLLERGFDLVLHVRHSRAGAEALAARAEAAGRRAWVLRADLAEPEELRALAAAVAARVPALELLVHNASVYEHCPLEALDLARLRRTLAVNLEAPLLLTQALLPLLRAAEGAQVITLTDASVARPSRPQDALAHYMASKAGLEGLTRALALELAPQVRVNGVAPGAVAFAATEDAPSRAETLRRVPLGREGSPDDVARAVAFLACEAPYMTGQILRVDGGLSVG